VLAGMGTGTCPELVAAVSNAGGLGILGADSMPVEKVREEVREIKRLTDKPFGVDLVFPARAPEQVGEVTVSEEEVPAPIMQIRRELEALGIKVGAQPQSHRMYQKPMKEKLDIVFEEKVPVFASGLGTPQWVIDECHKRGIKVICLVGKARHARRVAELGADVIVAQGHEAGGHCGRTPALVLVPQVVDAASVPVLAAGGIVDGRGIAAALCLGASGVWIGTRFLATKESSASDEYKRRILEADEDRAVWSLAYDGLGHRHLWNKYMDAWKGREHEALPFPKQYAVARPIFDAAEAHQNHDYMWLSAGMGSAMIREIKSAKEVLQDLVRETVEVLSERVPRAALV
ncbi:MAG: nitronate monooxygenase, partial [Chloroflexi bacterium]|nr:nitronate monooxygenase [Chloroflexota bacterium]